MTVRGATLSVRGRVSGPRTSDDNVSGARHPDNRTAGHHRPDGVKPSRLLRVAVLVAALVGVSGASGTSAAPVPSLPPELSGRTFEAAGTFSDSGPTEADLPPGSFLELRFTATSVVAVTLCGEYDYPSLTVRAAGTGHEVDFGSPTGPTCAGGGAAPPRGKLFWSDTGSDTAALGNGFTGIRLVEPTTSRWRSAGFVVPALLTLGVVAGVAAVRARRRRGALEGRLWPPGG